MIEIIGAAAEYPEKLIIPALQRTEIRQLAKMPFSDQRRAISRLLQQGWQCGVAWRQADPFGTRRKKRLFEPNRQASLIAPSDQRRARRRAVRRVGVRLCEFQAFGSQPIDVRRRIVPLTIAAHIRIAEVIGQDEDDVRLCRLSPGGATKTHPRERQRTRGSRLDKSTTRNCALLHHGDLSPKSIVDWDAA